MRFENTTVFVTGAASGRGERALLVQGGHLRHL